MARRLERGLKIPMGRRPSEPRFVVPSVGESLRQQDAGFDKKADEGWQPVR